MVHAGASLLVGIFVKSFGPSLVLSRVLATPIAVGDGLVAEDRVFCLGALNQHREIETEGRVASSATPGGSVPAEPAISKIERHATDSDKQRVGHYTEDRDGSEHHSVGRFCQDDIDNSPLCKRCNIIAHCLSPFIEGEMLRYATKT